MPQDAAQVQPQQQPQQPHGPRPEREGDGEQLSSVRNRHHRDRGEREAFSS